MSELTTRQFQNVPQDSVDPSRASKLADGLLAIAVLTLSVALTVTWIVALYWMAGVIFSNG